MKLRFLAIAGDSQRLDRIAAGIDHPSGPGLRLLLQRPSLRIWGHPKTPFVELSDGSGLLVGLLFRKVDGERIATLDSGEPLEQMLVRDHWGPYLLLREIEGGHSIFRDPSGALTAYHGTCEGLHVYASDSTLLQHAWPRPLRPSIDYLRQFLAYPFLRGSVTGDDAISELLPGQRRRVLGEAADLDLCWSPFDHLPAPGQLMSFDEAAERLRRVILNTVPRFAVPGETVALLLSGGLDSSILAIALAESGRPFRAVTFATRTADGDERRFARLVANHCGVPLTELVEPAWTPDFESFVAEPLRPPPNPMMQPFQRSIALEVIAAGTDILIDGGGGDNVLGRLSTASPVLDALGQAGAATAWQVIGELAQLHGSTRWTVLRAALRRMRRGRVRPWSPDTRFLAAGAPWQLPPPHPWLAPMPGLAAGKADQLNMIVGIRHFLADPAPGMPASFHPLLAQPLLEACLAMPTWLAMRGGQERAVARHAFRGLVPDAILDRRSKGRFESLFVRGFMASRARLESFLLDGRLRAAGLLDAEKVAACLRHPGQPRDHDYLRLLEIVPAEQWLRSFGG